MKKLFKLFLSLVCCISLLNVPNVFAEESSDENEKNQINSVQPRWWPGNPNPIPGTEDWFFQNQNYGSNAPIAFSRDCAKQALKDVLIPGGTVEAINYWLLKKAFSIGSFGVGFGGGYIYSYGSCLWNKGVRW